MAASLLTIMNRPCSENFILIVPSVVFIFAVRKYLFALWGVSNR